MNEIINFIKDICMINKEDTSCIGLSKLNSFKQSEKQTPAPKKNRGDIKISDLMRRTNN